MKNKKKMKSTIQLNTKRIFHMVVHTIKSDRKNRIRRETIGNDLINHAISFIETDFF
jgi:hypothetical protein